MNNKPIKIYKNHSLGILLALASFAFTLFFLYFSLIGAKILKNIPFSDLWVPLIVLILISQFIARCDISYNKTINFSSMFFIFIIILALILKMSLSGAFELYYIDYAFSGPSRRNIYTSWITWILSIFLCVLLLRQKLFFLDKTEKFDFFISVFAIAFILAVSYYTLINDSSMYADNTVNLGAVISPIINNYYGAIPPFDTKSQYGLYPIFITPVLKLFDLSIFSISIIFSFLFFVCFVSIYWYTKKISGSNFIALIVLISAFYLNTSFGNIWPAELYLQYRPIRMISPCISLILLVIYLNNPTALSRYLIFSILSAFVIWNVDSGIPTLASFIITSVMHLFFNTKTYNITNILKVLFILIEGVFVFALVMLVFATGCFVLKHEWMTIEMFLEPQLLWRGESLFFNGWSQPIILSALVYLIAISLSISKGVNNEWGIKEAGLLYTGFLGLGISTYGTLNPHAAALTYFLFPIILSLFASITLNKIRRGEQKNKSLIINNLLVFLCLFPICFSCISFVMHLNHNYGYWGVPTVYEVSFPSSENNKSLWPIPGKSIADTDYVKVNELLLESTKPYWKQKSEWLLKFDYIKNPSSKVFIASMHDHYLYAAIEKKNPMNMVNFQHIPNYSQWPTLYRSVQTAEFDYIVIDQEFFLRNSDASGPDNYDKFIDIMMLNYLKINEHPIGYDWHFPLWKTTFISVWKNKKI